MLPLQFIARQLQTALLAWLVHHRRRDWKFEGQPARGNAAGMCWLVRVKSGVTWCEYHALMRINFRYCGRTGGGVVGHLLSGGPDSCPVAFSGWMDPHAPCL